LLTAAAVLAAADVGGLLGSENAGVILVAHCCRRSGRCDTGCSLPQQFWPQQMLAGFWGARTQKALFEMGNKSAVVRCALYFIYVYTLLQHKQITEGSCS
jgi:hypothetical protein